jgi:Mg-chelatase subunit ChlD
MSTQPSDFIFDEPPTVPQTFHQLGILVLDGSGSMSDMVEGKITKAQTVDMAVRELLNRLIISKNKKDFSIALITFDHQSRVHTPPTRVADDKGGKIDAHADYDPMDGHGGGTDIAQALKEAHVIAEEFLNSAPAESVPHSVAIVVMSDGMSQTDPIPVADYIKQNPNITICSTLFALKNDTNPEAERAQQLLAQIATSPKHYIKVYDAETLRNFFIASVSSGKQVHIE